MKRILACLCMAVLLLGGCKNAEKTSKAPAPETDKVEQSDDKTLLPKIEIGEPCEEMVLLAPSDTEADPNRQPTDKPQPQESDAFTNQDVIEKTLFFKGDRNDMECRILMYHEFVEGTPDKEAYGTVSTPKRFEENIRYIQKSGYTIISLSDLLAYEQGKKALPQKTVIVTFDDGYTSNYTLIFPLVKKLKIPVTIFAVVSRMESDNRLTWAQMQEMEASGLVDIQSHSLYHQDHTTLSEEKLREYYDNSFKILDRILGKQSVRILSSPYGKYDEKSLRIAKEYDVQMHVTVEWKAVDMNHIDLMRLPRFNISYDTNMESILTY